MNLQKIKVYNLFWIVAAIILIVGLFGINNPDHTFDINVHDTYFVIADFYGTAFLFLFYFLMGLGYWFVQKVFKKQLVKPLTIIHSVILIGSFIVYWLVVLFGRLFVITDPNFPLFDGYQLINITMVTEILLILFIALPVYIVNLLIGIFRKKQS